MPFPEQQIAPLRRRALRQGRAQRVVLEGLGRVELTGFRSTSPHLDATFELVEDEEVPAYEPERNWKERRLLFRRR